MSLHGRSEGRNYRSAQRGGYLMSLQHRAVRNRRRGLILLGLLAAMPWVAAAKPLMLHYQERPPFSSTGPDGQPQGLLMEPIKRALARAGIDHRWSNTPSQRQLALIQQGHGQDCGIGWFYTAERETLGRFSQPIYRNLPFQALVRSDRAIAAAPSAAALLADASQPLLAKEGYSYGASIDALIQSQPAAVQRTSVESVPMARMVAAGRAGWMLISPEESEPLLASLGTERAALRLVSLVGGERGPSRHLYCNLQVSAALIARLDRALAER